MLFNSFSFLLIFLPITIIVFFTLSHFKYIKLAAISVVLASLTFYSYWDIRFLPLLVTSILFNYMIGSKIEKTRSKIALIFGITIDLIILSFFKYTDFLLQTINYLSGVNLPLPKIIMPLGISFFTFTQIAYLVDAYKGEIQKDTILTYSLFVTFFPHLIAGPILYHKHIIPQFKNLKHFVFSNRNMALGITILTIGLFKKVIIADNLAPLVKLVFDNASQVTFIEAWVGALGYTLQLYFDFSGYSDMALGLGYMLNIQLPINFNSPYKSLSIIDFWHRWHMTLSVFLKNYLYIPLGGNRHGQIKRMRNIMITMLLGGLWHGAGWTFVAWGGLHGIYLIINNIWRRYNINMPNFAAWTLTIICITVAWVIFRANSLLDAFNIVKAMLGMKEIILNIANLRFISGIKDILFVTFLIIVIKLAPNPMQLLNNFIPNVKWKIAISVTLVICLLNLHRVSEFLYFQF